MKIKLHIEVFAMLKEYFSPHFELEVPSHIRGDELLAYLAHQQPAAASLLRKCRIASAETMLDEKHLFTEDSAVYLIPPSSGG